MINDQFYADINECLEEDVCPAGSRCMNTIGSYTCTCGAGYFLFTKNNTCSGRKFNNDDVCSGRQFDAEA